MTMPEPAAGQDPAAEREAFAAQLLDALRTSPEVEDAVHAAAERAEMRHPHRQPPAVDAGRYARRT